MVAGHPGGHASGQVGSTQTPGTRAPGEKWVGAGGASGGLQRRYHGITWLALGLGAAAAPPQEAGSAGRWQEEATVHFEVVRGYALALPQRISFLVEHRQAFGSFTLPA